MEKRLVAPEAGPCSAPPRSAPSSHSSAPVDLRPTAAIKRDHEASLIYYSFERPHTGRRNQGCPPSWFTVLRRFAHDEPRLSRHLVRCSA